MAVVPMQKVRLVVHASQVDEALTVIQGAGALEFRKTNHDQPVASTAVFPHAQLLPRVQHAVQFLNPYAPKRKLWKKLREGSQVTLTQREVTQKLEDTDAIALIVEDLEDLQVEFAEANEKVRTLEEAHKILETWKTLPIALSKLSTRYTETLLISKYGVKKEEETLATLLSQIFEEAATPYVLTVVSDFAVAVTIPQDQAILERARQLIEAAGFTITTPPAGVETPDIELVAVSDRLAAARGEEALLHDQAEHFAITHFHTLQIAAEVLSWQKDRFAVVDGAGATKYTVIFDGWLNLNKRSLIEAEFKKRDIPAGFAVLTPEEGEEPPVEIENSPLIQPFEAVTRLYGMPGYKDLDPTVFLAGFFFLFFGLSLTDVGYGLFLMVVSVIILTLLKVAPAIRLFAKLLLFVGFSTVLVGMLFGGYLGIAPEHLPEILKKIQLFDPIGNPLPVFYTALGLGVVQVMVGMVLKIYSHYRNGRFMEGLLDQGPWLFMFCLGILYLATVLGYVEAVSTTQVVHLIYVGVVMIVLASGRKGKTVLEKVRSAALSLYDSIGYFSDILSYSRLLALGLATTALAFAVNLIAGMISDIPYIGALLALIVLVVGHLFTLVVNTLGAFIHSARLQFVEFFGKFIVGTGKEFAPLSRSEKHVTVTDE